MPTFTFQSHLLISVFILDFGSIIPPYIRVPYVVHSLYYVTSKTWRHQRAELIRKNERRKADEAKVTSAWRKEGTDSPGLSLVLQGEKYLPYFMQFRKIDLEVF